MVKIDEDLYGVFDKKGSLRFVSLLDQELVKFKMHHESTETDEVLALLQHSER